MESLVPFLDVAVSLFTLLATIIGLSFIYKGLQRAERLAKLQTTPLLSIHFTDGEKLKFDGSNICDENGNNINNPTFKIYNLGGTPAIITSMTRTWSVSRHDEGFDKDGNRYEKLPPPLVIKNLNKKSELHKEVALAIAAHDCSGEILSFYPDDGASLTDHLASFKASKETWNKVFFQGLIEFEDVTGVRFVCGFMHVFRSAAKGDGIRIALPERDAKKYNFHVRVDEN